MAYDGMTGEMLFARFGQVCEQGKRALQENDMLLAEQAWEEAASLSGYMASIQARPDILNVYGFSLSNLAETLRRLGAEPETEVLLKEAAEVFTVLAGHDPTEAEPALATTLIALAKVYRGAQFYVDFSRPPMTDVESMRAYRRDRLANGTWGGAPPSFSSPEWNNQAEAPLLEAIPLLRRLARTQRASFEPQLALALNLLGETYVNSDRTAEAEPPLRESEALYRGLVRDDPGFFQPLLTDTLDLLARANQAHAQPKDRISELEELLPELRRAGSVTDSERTLGVTMAKAGARNRLLDALQELASLYEGSGRVIEARDVRDGEAATLMTESLRVRWR